MTTLTTFLMFDNQSEEAANLYLSVFENGKILGRMPGPGGSVIGVELELFGRPLNFFNGGPTFKFSEGMSLFVSCETQAEIDRYWSKLTANGGSESQCGWLKDKFGVSWQIVPKVLGSLLGNRDRDAAGRALQAMLKMKKLDIATLQNAFDGK